VIQAPSAAEPLLAPARTRAVARASEIAAAARASRRELTIAAVIVVWIGAGAVLESHATIWPQRALGVITWGVLLRILRGERRDVRAQVAIVILVATAMEYTASGLVGLYTYRLHNVPLFVPPGHGLLYLTALALGRSQLFAVLRRPVIGATIAVGLLATQRSVRRDLLPLPRGLPPGRARAPRLRRCVPRLQLPRADGHLRRHLGVGDARSDGPRQHRQPAERHPRRVLLLRCRRSGRGRLAAGSHRFRRRTREATGLASSSSLPQCCNRYSPSSQAAECRQPTPRGS
jgi:hypothetical protein